VEKLDEYVTLLGTLLGAILGGIIGFAGAYLVERQRSKKEHVIEMRDKIYGPMFMEISRILEVVKSFQSSEYNSQENLTKMKNDFLFSTIEQGLKSRVSDVIDRLEKYQKVRQAAEIRLNEISLREVMDASGFNLAASHVFLISLIGETMTNTVDLRTAIFLGLTSEDFIKKEKEKWGEDLQIEAKFVGVKTTLKQYESLYASLLAKMEKEPLYLMEKEQRKRLIKELENLQDQVEPFVKPK
jgi:hypothetical protein